MSERPRAQGNPLEAKAHAERARLLYDAAETCWEVAKIIIRASDRLARRDHAGTRLSVTRASQMLLRLNNKLDTVMAGLDPNGSVQDRRTRLDA